MWDLRQQLDRQIEREKSIIRGHNDVIAKLERNLKEKHRFMQKIDDVSVFPGSTTKPKSFLPDSASDPKNREKTRR